MQGRQQLLILALVGVTLEVNEQLRTATIWDRYPVTGCYLVGYYVTINETEESTPGKHTTFNNNRKNTRQLQLRMFIIYDKLTDMLRRK